VRAGIVIGTFAAQRDSARCGVNSRRSTSRTRDIDLEATLSFLGPSGLPPTRTLARHPLIRVGNDYPLSGDWWISSSRGRVLALLILSVNIRGRLGPGLRGDAFNPKDLTLSMGGPTLLFARGA